MSNSQEISNTQEMYQIEGQTAQLQLSDTSLRQRLSPGLNKGEKDLLNHVISRGQTHMSVMRSFQHPLLTSSPFVQVEDLQDEYFEVLGMPDVTDLERVEQVLQNMGMDASLAENHCVHNIPKHDVQQIAPAEYKQIINPNAGLIIGFDNTSISHSLRVRGYEEYFGPELKYWSDVAFLQWKSHASEVRTLKYVLRDRIVNKVTKSIIELIKRSNDRTNSADLWPGSTYEAGSEEYLALLGTPLGSSVAYMLIQHRSDLGRKKVSKITSFDVGDDTEASHMLLFHIVEADE